MQSPAQPGAPVPPSEGQGWRDTRLSPGERAAAVGYAFLAGQRGAQAVAQTTQPVVRLIGYQRVTLEPGEAARVTFTVHADQASFTGLAGRRIVEPGDVELRFGRNSAEFAATVPLRLTGAVRAVGPDRRLLPKVQIDAISPSAAEIPGRSK